MNYERIAARFQQRLASTVAKYEGDIAFLQEEYEEKIEQLTSSLDIAEKKLENYESDKKTFSKEN